MIDFSIVYIIFSVVLFILSRYVKSKRLVKETDELENISILEINPKSEIKRGKKYLEFLLDQLKKTLLKEEQENSFDNPLKSIPEEELSQNILKTPFFTIVYASQSNTSKKFADRLMNDSQYFGLKSQTKNISELTIEDFNKNIYMVFLVSTYGEGGPTDDCIEFNKQLDTKKLFTEEFSNYELCYTVFGLGSSKYENFNSMSRKFDKIFEKNKIKKVVPAGEGDDAKNINEDFSSWRIKFWENTYNYFKNNSEKYSKLAEKMNLKELYENNQNEIEISISKEQNNNDDEIEINDYDYNTKRFIQSESAVIENIVELRKETINGSTLKIIYDLNNTKITYNVGDNIGIYPLNPESSVNKIISRFNFDSEHRINIKKLKKITKKLNIPNNLTVKELLTSYIDLSCQIK